VIHVAGTNGKGSTQAMIRAGLEGAGARVHAYTSPHLARFHERIRLAGDLIAEDHLTALLDECAAANGDDPITFFEITTAAAFLAFSRVPAYWLLLEVGLGGRLDATNVVDSPRLCIITPVSLDHQQYLGETIGEIAGEKAGILKRRVPAVIGPQTDEGLAVIEARAARLGCPLMVHGQHWHCHTERGRMVFQDENGLLDLPLPILPGPHQIDNAGAALMALRHLGVGDPEAAVTRTHWPARMQRLRQGPLVDLAPGVELWLDGGHNPAGGQALAATLAQMPRRPTHAICGMLNTKDIAGYLAPLAPHLAGLSAVSIPGEKNTLPADHTARVAREVGITADEAPGLAEALVAIARQHPEARVLICGSLYLAGTVLRENA
jgi:dihydrofolate synthase/folylpolyglutamate synthase